MAIEIYPLDRTDISISAYNGYIADTQYSSIFQSFEWGEIKKNDGWDVIRLVAIENTKIIASASCLFKTLPGGRSLFYIPRGPIVDYESDKGKYAFRLLIDKVVTIARKHSCIFLRISPELTKQGMDSTFIEECEFIPVKSPIMHTATFRIDLSQDEEAIYGKFENRVKSDIRKAMRHNVTVHDSNSTKCFDEFYQLLHDTSQRARFPIYSYNLMKYVWETLMPKGMFNLFLARYEGNVISGAFLLTFGRKCVYMWGGYSRAYPKISPNQLLHWEMIKWAKSKDYLIYDFQGTPLNPNKDHPLWGIHLFKKGFGGDVVELVGEYDVVFSKLLYKSWNLIEPHYPKLKNKVARFIK